MISKEREEIRARAEKAMPGPWEPYKGFEDDREVYWHAGPVDRGKYTTDQFNSSNTANFIAHAREDIPALLADVDHLRELLKRTISPLDHYADGVVHFPDRANAVFSLLYVIRKELGE